MHSSCLPRAVQRGRSTHGNQAGIGIQNEIMPETTWARPGHVTVNVATYPQVHESIVNIRSSLFERASRNNSATSERAVAYRSRMMSGPDVFAM